MNGLSEKTWKIIEKMFPPEQQLEVGHLLKSKCSRKVLGWPAGSKYRERMLEIVHFAVLQSSRGHLDELPVVIAEHITNERSPWSTVSHLEKQYAVWAEEYLAAPNEPVEPDPLEEPMEATQYQEGWVKCPNCGIRFSLNFSKSWNGERHRKCGQRLKIQGF